MASRTQQILDKLKVSNNSDDGEESGQFGKWSNKDLDPSPPSQRTWSAWSFFAFQFSIAFSPTTYNAGASLYAIGLHWWTIFIASSMFVSTFSTCQSSWLICPADRLCSYCVGYDCHSPLSECEGTCEISYWISNSCPCIGWYLWISHLCVYPRCKPYPILALIRDYY